MAAGTDDWLQNLRSKLLAEIELAGVQGRDDADLRRRLEQVDRLIEASQSRPTKDKDDGCSCPKGASFRGAGEAARLERNDMKTERLDLD